MSAKTDIQIGVHATVFATRDEVAAACRKAAEALGNRATVSVSAAKITVKIQPGLVKAVSPVSPTVGINLRPGKDGAIVVDAKIEQWRTRQQRVFLIPVAPKMLIGKSSYLSFVQSLEQELRAVDRGRGSVRRVGAAR
jgi:hypothetical protein